MSSRSGDPARSAAAGPEEILADLRREALRLGFSRLGVARAAAAPHHAEFRGWLAAGMAGVCGEWLARHESLRGEPRSLLEGARSVVMLATDHAAAAPESTGPGPGRGRVARYAWGDDYHGLLRGRLNRLAAWLERRMPGSRSRGVVDSAPLAERDFAWLAGLGWFGKNTMLIDRDAGSFFLLSALVTDIDLPAHDTPVADHCGTCTACLDACPTGALPAPRLLDARRCISSITIEDHGPIDPEFRTALGDWIFGCDICQEVCPWNRMPPGSGEPALQPRGGESALSLTDLLALDEPAFRARFRGSPILRAKRSGLLRSAALALGNRPHPPALAALLAALADSDPTIRGAVAWALGRWIAAGVLPVPSRAALVARVALETDPDVVGELQAALAATPPHD